MFRNNFSASGCGGCECSMSDTGRSPSLPVSGRRHTCASIAQPLPSLTSSLSEPSALVNGAHCEPCEPTSPRTFPKRPSTLIGRLRNALKASSTEDSSLSGRSAAAVRRRHRSVAFIYVHFDYAVEYRPSFRRRAAACCYTRFWDLI